MSEYLETLRKQLEDADATFEVISAKPAFTAQEAAAAAHVPGHAFLKSVVVNADGRPILLALPAPHVIDTERLRERLGSKTLRLAVEDEFRELFPGYELGAIPPFAPGPHVPLFADKGLLENHEIAFKVGSHMEIARLRSADYVRLATPQVIDFAQEPVVALPQVEPATGLLSRLREAQAGWLFGAMAAAAALAVPVVMWQKARPTWLRPTLGIFAGGMAVGGALVALADPRMGRRRRALVRDKGGHYFRLGLRRCNGAVKQVRDRSRGLQHRFHHKAPTQSGR